MPELQRFLFLPNAGKVEQWVGSEAGGDKPLIYGFPGLGVNRHLMNFSAFFAKLKPSIPFSFVVMFYLKCYKADTRAQLKCKMLKSALSRMSIRESR